MQKTYFISYNSADRDWAYWIAWTLNDLGHRARIHEWEIGGGGNVPMWMEQALAASDAMIAVVSPAFLNATYSQAEVNAGNWRAFQSRDGFVKPVVVADVVDWPIFLGNLKRLSLIGMSRTRCRDALAGFLSDPVAPSAEPGFPGTDSAVRATNGPAVPESPPPSGVEIDRLLAAHRRATDLARISTTVGEWASRTDLPRQADESLGQLFNEDALYCLNTLGDLDAALRRFDAAMSCHVRTFGEASNAVAVLKSNKASALLELGSAASLDQALDLAREAVAAQEARFGPNPPEADVSRLMTARVLHARRTPRDLDEADRLLAEAARVARTPETARDLEGMSARIAKARRSRAGLHRALEIEQRLLGATADTEISDEYATSLNNLAFTYWALGERQTAEQHLQRALELRRTLHHPGHPVFADIEASLAALKAGHPSGFEPED